MSGPVEVLRLLPSRGWLDTSMITVVGLHFVRSSLLPVCWGAMLETVPTLQLYHYTRCEIESAHSLYKRVRLRVLEIERK